MAAYLGKLAIAEERKLQFKGLQREQQEIQMMMEGTELRTGTD